MITLTNGNVRERARTRGSTPRCADARRPRRQEGHTAQSGAEPAFSLPLDSGTRLSQRLHTRPFKPHWAAAVVGWPGLAHRLHAPRDPRPARQEPGKSNAPKPEETLTCQVGQIQDDSVWDSKLPCLDSKQKSFKVIATNTSSCLGSDQLG